MFLKGITFGRFNPKILKNQDREADLDKQIEIMKSKIQILDNNIKQEQIAVNDLRISKDYQENLNKRRQNNKKRKETREQTQEEVLEVSEEVSEEDFRTWKQQKHQEIELDEKKEKLNENKEEPIIIAEPAGTGKEKLKKTKLTMADLLKEIEIQKEVISKLGPDELYIDSNPVDDLFDNNGFKAGQKVLFFVAGKERQGSILYNDSKYGYAIKDEKGDLYDIPVILDDDGYIQKIEK